MDFPFVPSDPVCCQVVISKEGDVIAVGFNRCG